MSCFSRLTFQCLASVGLHFLQAKCVQPQFVQTLTSKVWLQTLQNAATLLFGGMSSRSSVLPVLHDELHWLPIKQIIDFEIDIIFFKAMNWLAVSFLGRCSSPMSCNPAVGRKRSADQGYLIFHRVKNKSNGLPIFMLNNCSAFGHRWYCSASLFDFVKCGCKVRVIASL